MIITLHLTPEEAAQLMQAAEQQRQPPEGVAHSLVHHGLLSAPQMGPDQVPVSEEAHEELVKHLLDAGLMTERPTRLLGPPPPPISVEGEPVSQTILAERR